MTSNDIQKILCQKLKAHELPILRRFMAKLEVAFIEWLEENDRILADLDHAAALELAVEYMVSRIRAMLGDIRKYKRLKAQFIGEMQHAKSQEEVFLVLEEHVKELANGVRDEALDRKAMSRWFGPDAIQDRYEKRLNTLERDLAVVLIRIGHIASELVSMVQVDTTVNGVWNRIGLEKIVAEVQQEGEDPRVAIATFKALAFPLMAMTDGMPVDLLSPRTVRFIYEAAQNRRVDVWVQVEALSLLQLADPASFISIAGLRFRQPGGHDDIFVRHRAAVLVGDAAGALPGLAPVLDMLPQDPSPYVRQAAAGTLSQNPGPETIKWLRQLAASDNDPKVRAGTFVAALTLVADPRWLESYREMILHALSNEQDAFVIRTVCHCCREATVMLSTTEAPDDVVLSQWCEQVMTGISELAERAVSGDIRLWADQAYEFIWSEQNATRRDVKVELNRRLQKIRRRSSGRLPKNVFRGLDDITIARLLAVLVQDDFGLDISRGWLSWNVSRDHKFGLRFWRVLYESLHPSPEKRQAFSHTTGRTFWGDIRVPGPKMAELTRTKVPGEPLFFSKEGSWRPWLPLVDDLISSLDQGSGKEVRFFTSTGVAVLKTPGVLKRFTAYAKLSTSFAEFADLRNQTEDPQGLEFLEAIRKLGFGYDQISYERHVEREAAQPVETVSLCMVPAVMVPWQEFWNYFVSIFENTLEHLAVYGIGITGIFAGLHFWRNHKLKKARRAIPLVLGGWGTRGKSGTERLKAAVVNALGYSFVSKTTGCEAMFLYAHPFGETKEYFLFRPYDKATIWEQQELLCTTAELDAEVFLWECMGLSPEYVEILQNAWTKDDYSTITNTYPDHEDIQGPAGINLPDVMTRFIPRNGMLITTEEQMTPVLKYDALHKNTEFHSVGWLEAGLLTDDILERFPYSEHPYNIALVQKMFAELGVDGDFALKAMADRVVPDLGVLKTFEPAPVRGRSLIFSNGMSANERMATLGNWRRAGFADHDWQAIPGERLVTVVNNRADRIARSRAFASVIVQDLTADIHVLIGSNLKGLKGYIDAEWEQYLEDLTLWPEPDTSNEQAVAEMKRLAVTHRLPFTREDVLGRAEQMLSELPEERQHEILASILIADKRRHQLDDWDASRRNAFEYAFKRELAVSDRFEYIMKEVIEATTETRARLTTEFMKLLDTWFQEKFVLVEDYYASGDAVIHTIVEALPPGVTAKVMGMQNIKGTGLDFVYRWLAWDACFAMAGELGSPKRDVVLQALDKLQNYPELGLLAYDYIEQAVKQLDERAVSQDMAIHVSAELLLNRVRALKASTGHSDASPSAFRTVLSWFIMRVEEAIDSVDAVRRRHRSERIYQDLIDERIGRERAMTELKELTKRQKGGWLEALLTGKK